MSEVISEIWYYVKEILPYLSNLVIAGTAYLCFRIYSKSSKAKEKIFQERIDKAESKQAYTICPHCHERLPLSEINFYLPGDVKDNNLDGIPDVEQEGE